MHSKPINNSPLKKREANWTESTFAKASGTVTGAMENKLANS